MVLQRRLGEALGETFDGSCVGMHRFYLSSRVLGSSTFTGWKGQMEIENLKCRKEELTCGPKLQRRLKGKAEV